MMPMLYQKCRCSLCNNKYVFDSIHDGRKHVFNVHHKSYYKTRQFLDVVRGEK